MIVVSNVTQWHGLTLKVADSWVVYTVCLFLCEWMCLTPSKVSPDRHYFHITEWASFFYPLTYIYRQKTRAFPTVCSLSICLSLMLEREEGPEAKIKNAHRRIQRFTGCVAPVFKLCFLHWQHKRRFNYFGIDALVTKYRHFCSFVFCFICLFVLENKSHKSFYTLTTCLCPSTEKR